MRYEASIKAVGEPDKLFDAFMLEKGEFARSSFDVVKKEDGVEFVVKADDPTALRATLSSITKLLEVFEKVK